MTVGRVLAMLSSATLLSGCTEGSACPEAVSLEQYGDVDRCWGGNQPFAARVALTPTGSGAYAPHFISNHCLVRKADLPAWATIADHRIPLVHGDGGLAKKSGLLDGEITTNMVDHLQSIRLSSAIYNFEGTLEAKNPEAAFPEFRILQVSKLKATGSTFRDLMHDRCYQ